MDRFFSKLDLRDIKIDPEASFPPDENAYTDDSLTDWTHGETSTGSVATETPPETDHSEVLKVSARSRPSAVAGAIAGVVRESGRAEVQAIGAGATNQAVKAVAIARDYLQETGIEAVCLPAFIDVTIDNEDRTAIRLIVEPR
jgi:stage V sporulation protein S